VSAKSRAIYPHYPKPGQCCERCVFGTGEHAEGCMAMRRQLMDMFRDGYPDRIFVPWIMDVGRYGADAQKEESWQ
jgi:hypothetical protein